MLPALDYLRPSPVRGQLEPPDSNTLPGWRYIQTTDTPNEFKVLLPPGTAAMYDQLLKFEALELSRKPTISWERIMQIRHLKDRMIRKSQRLSKASLPKKLSKGEPLTFQTIVAPVDFRVKEMEKWFREQQRRTSAVVRRQTEPVVHYMSLNEYSNKPILLHEPDYHRLPSSDRFHSSKRPIAVSRPKAIPPPAPQHVRSLTDTYPQSGPFHSHAAVQATKAPSALSIPLRAISSPPALPILLRSQRSALEEKFNQRGEKASTPTLPRTDSSELSLPNASHVAVKGSVSSASSSQESVAVAEPDKAAAASGEPQLTRRRSCIKRSSIGDIPKTVSWADATEWESRCTWQEIREIYLDQVSGLDALYEQVAQGLDNLRLESENLQRVEKVVVQQREALRTTFQNLEQKRSLLQSKVQEALQEADHVLSLVGVKMGG
ncbi:hypothetical protein APHAL10511_006407 [Amanita phalloides]|nr:hypothetical protein APHAL10511_006407 [Amanita phalloides]